MKKILLVTLLLPFFNGYGQSTNDSLWGIHLRLNTNPTYPLMIVPSPNPLNWPPDQPFATEEFVLKKIQEALRATSNIHWYVTKDTITIKYGINFIKIGDRVYKIESPILTEVPKADTFWRWDGVKGTFFYQPNRQSNWTRSNKH